MTEISFSYQYGNRGARLDVQHLQLDQRPTLLLGVNGAGKSTLFRVLAGQLRPQRQFRHTKTVHWPGAVYVPQNFVPIRGFSVRDYVGYLAWLQGTALREAENHADKWIEFVGLAQLRDRDCRQLSGGQQSRLQLAAALNSQPTALLLDEPSAALDPLAKQEILDLYPQIIATGISLWVSTHSAAEVAHPFTRVIVLHEGAIVFDASLAKFQGIKHGTTPTAELHPIVQALAEAAVAA